MAGAGRLPLEGLTVVAVEQAVAAPFCTARLADAGARVIKIERPEGDFARGYDAAVSGQSSYFVWLNRGKESVALDLTTADGKAALQALLEEADVLVQNLKPGSLERLGFGPDALRKSHPRLVICSISGYGETGPFAERKAYDLLIQAESGLCSITGGPSEPARVGISIVDVSTGATAHAAILEALIARGVTGDGADIRVSMFDVMADWLTVPLLQHEGGKPPKRIGMAHPSIAPYGVFTTKDGKQLLISIQSEREWKKFCITFLQDPAAVTDPTYASNVARVKNRTATDDLVGSVFAELSEEEARARLTDADVAFAGVNDMGDLSQHPHLRRVTVETEAGPVSYPAPGPIFIGAERQYGAVPALDEHKETPPKRG
ncbi:CoA transferase [Hwanghaeella grinnelliae]|uniref:CoA transferase n=1 Tax=Hwanghaeella grinnelliae TaxID=2500179 RepID=A0A437QHW2_9PROT|nr:CaiB/BaiF CoA-transferase family protein [Hwanghaeella grinnelliae]RVU34153.1 CoA transferase [Hwanghaeella grinnelliae]